MSPDNRQNQDASGITWLRAADSADPEANKVTIAFECCDPQCLAMCDAGEEE